MDQRKAILNLANSIIENGGIVVADGSIAAHGFDITAMAHYARDMIVRETEAAIGTDDSVPNWLETAISITGDGPHQRDYGTPLINFLRIAIRWSEWLDHYVSPVDVAMMMIDMKIARQQNTHKDDNLIDIAGYINCIQEMDTEMKRCGYSTGIKFFDNAGLASMTRLVNELARYSEKGKQQR